MISFNFGGSFSAIHDSAVMRKQIAVTAYLKHKKLALLET